MSCGCTPTTKRGSWFASIVGNRPSAWWLARQGGRVVGYMLIDGEHLDHLYVHPEAQGRGVGSTLLHKARSLSPRRIALVTFQRNVSARAFYEKHGFRPLRFTAGRKTRWANPTCTTYGRPRTENAHRHHDGRCLHLCANNRQQKNRKGIAETLAKRSFALCPPLSWSPPLSWNWQNFAVPGAPRAAGAQRKPPGSEPQTRQFDPERPFEVRPGNGWEGQGSGRRLCPKPLFLGRRFDRVDLFCPRE